jgi:hypothetical protein
MPIANTYNPSVDPFLAWQAANGAAYCNRITATITQQQCKLNQCNSNNDNRCRGCAGLFNQDEAKQVHQDLSLLRSNDKIIAAAEANEPKTSTANDPDDGFAALDEIIDGLYENPKQGDDFDDLELDLDDEQLLALFPELAKNKDNDSSTDFQRFTEYQTAMPRYAVYHGRCKKCGGYVANCREWHDDNVFRCLACGWRTGVEYERNKVLHAAGGVTI